MARYVEIFPKSHAWVSQENLAKYRVTRMFANQDHRNDVGVDQDPRNDVGVDEDHGNDVGVDQDHRNVCELLMPFRVTRGNS